MHPVHPRRRPDQESRRLDEAGQDQSQGQPQDAGQDQDQDQPQDAKDRPSAPEEDGLAFTVKIRHADPQGADQDGEEKDQEQDRPSRAIPHPATIVFGIPAPGQARRGESQKEQEEEEPPIPSIVPVVPVRDVVIFNYMFLPLFISRPSSAEAVQSAVGEGRHVLILTQRDEKEDEPKPQDLFSVGTVVKVLRMLRLPDGKLKILVHGEARAKVAEFTQEEPFLSARIEILPEPEVPIDVNVEAMLRFAREECEKVLSMKSITSPELLNIIQGVNEPGRLADLVASSLRLKLEDAQRILESVDPVQRLKLVNDQLAREAEVTAVQLRIQNTAKEEMDKAQKDYFLREQIKAIHQELGDGAEDPASETERLREALKEAHLPEDVQKEADKQLRRLSLAHGDSAEAGVIRTYLELLSELPWDKLTEDNLDIKNAQAILDEDHFGLDKIKDRILEYLSVYKLNPDTKGSILCFVGPPGVGKTSLGRSIARALGRKFERLSLGGMHDEAEIRGHRRTYIGAMPGRIIQCFRHAGTRNPVIMLDELDKIGNDFHGDPQSALLEVLDPEQNSTFSDHYLGVPFDLSKVIFLCTANQLETIPSALRDRTEIIRLAGYTQQEKLEIAKRYLVKKRVDDNGLKEGDFELEDQAIERIILEYTREAGVRELERKIGTLCRKTARRKAEDERPPFHVGAADLPELLGPPVFLEEDRGEKLLPGMAYGLAWTQAGGDVLTIEAAVMKGKGAIQLTGSLGDVMKESAQAATSYIRSKADEFGVKADFLSKSDIHVHVPDGATPKDGPSAGVTLTTALLSALKGKPVCEDLCMTGEIDLKGRVLPVGGIKEKVLGAVARGLKRCIIPWQNKKDLHDIPEDLLAKIAMHPVRYYTEVYRLAFQEEPGAKAKAPARKAAAAGRTAKEPAKKAPAAGKTAKAKEPARKAPAKKAPGRKASAEPAPEADAGKA
ncbi:MAG: endopeptidase La [Desulfovibrio sp.]|nr:endopeptidase La [Desulfovibrio sp.]